VNPATLNAIFGLVNAALPNIGNLVVAIKNSRGGVDVAIVLDQADPDYQKAIEQGQAFLSAHPKLPPATPAA
jgi:hypothetical protein